MAGLNTIQAAEQGGGQCPPPKKVAPMAKPQRKSGGPKQTKK